MAKTRVDITDTLNTWKEKTNDISLDLGDRTLLTTDEDSDVVGSINSIDSNLGARENLTTNDKRSVVHAVNELDSDVGDITTLNTETQASVVRAMNELELNHNNLDSDLGGRIADGRQGNYVRGIKVRGSAYPGSPGARNTSSFAVAINDMMDSIGGGRLRTDEQAVKQAINELHDEMYDSGVDFGNFGNSHSGARLTANSLKEAIQEIIDEVGDIGKINTNWTGGTSGQMGSGSHDSSVVGALLALRGRIDSVDADIDQPVLTTSGVVFNKVTLGTYPATTTGNAEYNNAGISRTGDYTIDVSGDITLDGDGNDIIFKNGAGGDQVKHTLADNAAYTIAAPSNYTIDVVGDITLDADGAQVYMKDGGATKYTFNMGTNQEIDVAGNLTLDVAGDITLDAGGTDVFLKDGTNTHYTFAMGTTDELTTRNQFKVDAGGKITLDAADGVLELQMKDSNHIVFDLAKTYNTMTVDNHFVVDVAGDITLDADGNDIYFKNGGGGDQVKHTLADNGNYTIAAPLNYTLDVTGDIVLDADGAQVYMKDGGTTKYTFNMGNNQEIDVVGSLTLDVQTDIILDADGGNVYLKDGGTQFARFEQVNTNYLKMYVKDRVLFETKAAGTTGNPRTTWNGPIFLDSALRHDITDMSVAGALNRLDEGQDKLQTLVGADSDTSFSSSYISSTTVVPAIKEIANEMYNSGVDFGNFSAGAIFQSGNPLSPTSRARLTANDFQAAIIEIMEELGDINWLQNGTKFGNNTGSAFEALNELWDLIAALDSDATADFSGVNNNIGTLSSLTTTAQGSLVAAINEIDADINAENTGIAARLSTVEGYSTTDISEPSSNATNLYFTNARARGAVSASDGGGYGSFSYASSTGVFTYTGPSNANIHDRFEAGEGIDINAKSGDASKKIIKAETATSSNLGVAKFSTDNFSVSSGNVTIKNDGVSYAEIQNVATADRVLGSTTAGGAVSEVQVATGMIKNDAVTYAKMQHVATANRVLGSTTANGAVSEVQVQTAMIASDAVTQAKIADDAVGKDQLDTLKTLKIKNAAGTELFKLYGAGA